LPGCGCRRSSGSSEFAKIARMISRGSNSINEREKF
jgi:hypothetical protein